MLRITKDRALVEALKSGGDFPHIDAAERRMLEYARKLTLAPKDMNEEDVQLLRDAGFSDFAVLAINAATAYMNFINRVAQGLGVALEEDRSVFTR